MPPKIGELTQGLASKYSLQFQIRVIRRKRRRHLPMFKLAAHSQIPGCHLASNRMPGEASSAVISRPRNSPSHAVRSPTCERATFRFLFADLGIVPKAGATALLAPITPECSADYSIGGLWPDATPQVEGLHRVAADPIFALPAAWLAQHRQESRPHGRHLLASGLRHALLIPSVTCPIG